MANSISPRAKLITERFSRTRRQDGKRNGLTLILVISIIVLFLLMGTSFVVMSQNYLSASRSRANQLDVRGDRPRDLLQRSLYDVLRGPALTNSESPLRGLSLLADQYGYGISFNLIDGAPVFTKVTVGGGFTEIVNIEFDPAAV